MNKLYAMFPALVLAAGLATTAVAQNAPVKGYFYNKHSNNIMLVENNQVKAYPFDAAKLPAALFELDENAGSASLKNVLSNRFIGKVGNFNAAIGTQPEEFRYKVSKDFDGDSYMFYSFADTTSAGSQVSLHNNGNNNVVRWNSGVGEDASAPSRWYFVSEDEMQSFASLRSNKLMLKDLAEEVKGATVPAYKKVGEGLITAVSQLGTNAQEKNEGSLAALIGKASESSHPNNNFFHSSWSGGSPNPAVHNLWVTFENTDETKDFIVEYSRRMDNKDNRPLEYKIYGGTKDANGQVTWEDTPFTTITEGGYGLDSNDYNGLGATKGHFTVNAPKAYTALRFDVTKTSSNSRFFTMGTFQLFKAQVDAAQPRVLKNHLITAASQISSDNKEPREGSYANLLDGNPATIFHSNWSTNQGNNGKDHNLILTFNNDADAKQFKLAYNSRKNGNGYSNIPVKVDIYGGTKQGNSYVWNKISTYDSSHPFGYARSFNENQFGGLSGIVDINTGSNVYEAFKLSVVKTDNGKKYFALGDIDLYTEETLPAGTTAATPEQLAALNTAVARLDENVLPYQHRAYDIEAAARKALNDIVPGIVDINTKKQEVDNQLADAFAKAEAAFKKATDAIAKSDFTTELIKQQAAQNGQLVDELSALYDEIVNLYPLLVGGYTADQLKAFQEKVDNLLSGVSQLNVGTKDLEAHVANFVDPASRFRLVPIEPWMSAEYPVHWNKSSNLQVKQYDRFSRGFRVIVGDNAPQEFLSPENFTYIYNEFLNETVKVQPGEEVRVEPQYNNNWMHAYVYLDANQSKTFTWEGLEPGKTNGEVVAYNFYQGKNSLGETASNQSRRDNGYFIVPAFKAPEKPGTYRVRTKIDWNNIDPAGQFNGEYTSNFIDDNRGYIFDFLLEVVDPTAIDAATTATATSAPAFDLTGRRVNHTQKGQLLIVGGKKQIKK